jgi:hypothetical protein
MSAFRVKRTSRPSFSARMKRDGFGRSTVIYPICSALTNSSFLEDRCSLSDQKSFILASSRRAFILAMRDGDRANKNEIGIFVSSVTSNDFPHAMPLTAFTDDRGTKIRKWANLCTAMSQFISPGFIANRQSVLVSSPTQRKVFNWNASSLLVPLSYKPP